MQNPTDADPKFNRSWLLQLRDAAMTEPDVVKRHNLRKTADALQEANKDFYTYGDFTHLTLLNGVWSYALRLWYQRTPIGEDPAGGHMPVPQEERKAA